MLFSSCEKLRYELVPTRIEGKVIDILTGEPIPNAEITLWESEYYRYSEVAHYQADAQGNFKIKHKFKYYKDDPPKDRYHISAKKDGYLKNVYRVHETEIKVNDEAISEIEPTRANKDIVLKLIPICSLELDVEDVYPYYELQNNITNYLYLRFKSLETSTIGWKYYGRNEARLSNQYHITEIKVDTLSAGKYRLILYERDKNYIGSIFNLVDTFYVDLKPNQINKIKLYF